MSVIGGAYSTVMTAPKVSTEESEKAKLKEACVGFESIFMHKIMQTMRSATMDGGLIKKSTGEKIFTDMLDQELSDISARTSVNGLADMMYEHLKGSLNFGKEPSAYEGNKSIQSYLPKTAGKKLDIAG